MNWKKALLGLLPKIETHVQVCALHASQFWGALQGWGADWVRRKTYPSVEEYSTSSKCQQQTGHVWKTPLLKQVVRGMVWLIDWLACTLVRLFLDLKTWILIIAVRNRDWARRALALHGRHLRRENITMSRTWVLHLEGSLGVSCW